MMSTQSFGSIKKKRYVVSENQKVEGGATQNIFLYMRRICSIRAFVDFPSFVCESLHTLRISLNSNNLSRVINNIFITFITFLERLRIFMDCAVNVQTW